MRELSADLREADPQLIPRIRRISFSWDLRQKQVT